LLRTFLLGFGADRCIKKIRNNAGEKLITEVKRGGKSRKPIAYFIPFSTFIYERFLHPLALFIRSEEFFEFFFLQIRHLVLHKDWLKPYLYPISQCLSVCLENFLSFNISCLSGRLYLWKVTPKKGTPKGLDKLWGSSHRVEFRWVILLVKSDTEKRH
jgi:hypothetical protein